MSNKVAKNYIYNLIYQVIVLIIPLITTPYLSRILGVEGIGIYSYNYSIAYYFSLFIMLGINNYGNRSIAKCLNKKEKEDAIFWEIYAMQFIMGVLVLSIYLIYTYAFSTNRLISLCYIPFLISYMLDINWLFFGQENFKIVLLRNIIIKILTALCIFIFVKNQSDLIKYILIMSIEALLSQIIMWRIVLKEKTLKKTKVSNIFKHLKPNLILFVPVIAVSIYRTMDKIMLGSMSNMFQVGYYENSEKIVSILLTFITALGTVMLPRMSALYETNSNEQIDKLIEASFVFISLISSAVSFGVASIATNLTVVYFGREYFDSGRILQMLCITIPFISYANIIRMQILVPQGKDKEYVVSCCMGAIVNFVLNSYLIPKYQAIGATIGTIVAEATVTFVQIFSSKYFFKLKKYSRTILLFWLNGLIMYIFIKNLTNYLSYSLFNLALEVGIGVIIYTFLIIMQWKIFNDEYLNTIIENIYYKFILDRKRKKI